MALGACGHTIGLLDAIDTFNAFDIFFIFDCIGLEGLLAMAGKRGGQGAYLSTACVQCFVRSGYNRATPTTYPAAPRQLSVDILGGSYITSGPFSRH